GHDVAGVPGPQELPWSAGAFGRVPRIRGALSGSVCGRACPPDLDSNLHADIQRTIIPPHVLEVLP
ncbi:MAG: hypothetical protein M3434_07885, partial [Gemmatimonadota bacterium]|nr:hypothetical protein [Gemmatimonadota bacterium]